MRYNWILLALLLIYCNDQPFVQGKRLYEYHCSGCHMSDGKGIAGLYPPLFDSDYLEARVNELPCIIRYGLSDTIEVNGRIYDQPMLGIEGLSSAEIANISNYIMHNWLGGDSRFSERQITRLLNECTK